MEAEIIRLIASQGVFALLFTYLLFHVLRTSAQREEKLMDFFQDITTKMTAITQQLEAISSRTDQIPVLAERVGKLEDTMERLADITR